MSSANKYESFYTDSQDNNIDYVDLMEILHRSKQVLLYIDETEMAIGGCDENGEELDETYLSRHSFYALLYGLENLGYTIKKKVCDRNTESED